jgi:hypothetical protein
VKKSIQGVSTLLAAVMASIAIVHSDARSDEEFVERCKDCDPPKEVCFNVYCNYAREDRYGFEKCKAVSVFKKLVAADGDEIQDVSRRPQNPQLAIECDSRVIFNNSGRRYTDYLGTRIQAETGPYPAILLPKHALEEGRRYVNSSLELDGQFLKGYCYLYTGPQ